jgi:hypothetical protein
MKGKISAGIFRAMAVVSALAIGGGYVAWRQAEARKDMAEQAEATVKRERERLMREMDEAWQADAKQLELLPGSKNPGRSMTRGEIDEYLEKGRDFIHPIPGIPQGAEEVSNVTPLLPGSKIGIVVLPNILPEPPKQKDPKLLPGSKSFIFETPVKQEPHNFELPE